MLQISIRVAAPQEHDRARAAYSAWGYHGGVQPTDVVLLADCGGEVVGLVRLTHEAGITVLRGMQVAPLSRRQGIGTQLLRACVRRLAGVECFCVPYSHLVAFYEAAGFAEWPLEHAPAFLAQRIAEYTREGLSVTLMRRPASARAELGAV